MANPQWRVWIDWDADGVWGEANEDVTSDLMALHWEWGRELKRDRASAARLDLTLRILPTIPDAVLSGIVGKIGTVSYGPAGNASGQRKVTGEFLCRSYHIVSKVNNQVRFAARFKQDDAISITTWA